MNKVRKTERGWPGHFIMGSRCVYHRNTLLESGDVKVIVSTVGNLRRTCDAEIDTLGVDRYYETMTFMGQQDGCYVDINVEKELCLSDGLYYDKPSYIPDDVDNLADAMHEKAVKAVFDALAEGDIGRLLYDSKEMK